jgi:predicted NBD/HSP70 family sugar kinase
MYIVADIGGTKMRVAGSSDLSSFNEPVILDTPQEYDKGIALFAETARKIAGGESIEKCAVGIAGTLSPDKRALVRSTHLQQWGNHSFGSDLEAALHSSIYVENDTALVGLGEAVFGAGKGATICAYITVSTGVNGIRIINGKIDQGIDGFEIGGQYLAMGEHPETFEDLVSGYAIEQKYGKHPRELGKEWDGWENLARTTAFGVHNTILHWSPERVVLGGSMFNEIGISIDRVQNHLQTIMKKFATIPDIVHAELHDTGGLYGGLARLKEME